MDRFLSFQVAGSYPMKGRSGRCYPAFSMCDLSSNFTLRRRGPASIWLRDVAIFIVAGGMRNRSKCQWLSFHTDDVRMCMIFKSFAIGCYLKMGRAIEACMPMGMSKICDLYGTYIWTSVVSVTDNSYRLFCLLRILPFSSVHPAPSWPLTNLVKSDR